LREEDPLWIRERADMSIQPENRLLHLKKRDHSENRLQTPYQKTLRIRGTDATDETCTTVTAGSCQ